MSEKKESRQPKKKKPASRTKRVARIVQVGNIEEVNGNVTIAGGDIVTHINNIQQSLTPGEVVETDLQIELDTLKEGVQGYLEELKRQALSESGARPYKDLEYYTLSEAGEFFGRKQAIRELREALKRNPLTVLQAESGAGKTSLLQAGLIPCLMTEDQLAVWLRPQFANPTIVIKKKFLGDLKLTPKIAEASLAVFLRRIQRIVGGQTTLYLILDQFEEFFSKYTDEADRQVFVRELAECLNDATLNVRWVLSLTTEALGQLYKLEPYIQLPKLNVYTLNLFNRQEAAEAIAEPAQRHGFTFEAGLLEQLLDDLSQRKDAPILPTQIQLVCTALYKDLRGKGTVFTRALYEQKGRTKEILHGYVGNVLQHDLLASERAPAYKILEELVTSEKKRTIRLKTDLETVLASMGISQTLAESTLNHLVSSRLLRRLGDGEHEIKYEIVHDYLLNEIEIDESVRGVKEVEELLEQGVKNWKRFGVTLNSDTLALISKKREELRYSSDALCLLLLSLVDLRGHAREWRYYLARAKQTQYAGTIAGMLASLISHENKKMRDGVRKVLWYFLRECPAPNKPNVILWNLGFRIPAFVIRAIMIGVAVWVAYGLIWIVSRDQLENIGWQSIQSLAPGCLATTPADAPVLVTDPSNPSNLVVFGQSQAYVCQSLNAGDSWTSVASDLDPSLSINAVAIYEDLIVLLSRQQVSFRSARNDTWKPIDIQIGLDQEFKSAVIGGDGQFLFLANSPREILSIQLTSDCRETIETEKALIASEEGKCWDQLETSEIAGEINFLSANERYLVVNTREGTWYSNLSMIDWKKQPGLDGQVLSFAMNHNTILHDGVFIVVRPDGAIQRGQLGISELVTTNDWPFPSTDGEGPWDWPPNTQVIAASQFVYYAVTNTGSIQRYPGWSIFDRQWWSIMQARISAR